MREYRTILLGGGMVAGYAAKEFVEAGLKSGELGIVSADSALPYERPPLSKGFLSGKENEQSILISQEEFYREHDIGVHLNVKVERIDINGNPVAGKRLMAGGEEFRFQNLVLATGATPRTLKVPGAESDTVLYLRSLNDSARLRDRLKSSKKVLVAGGGFIGMEVASQSAQLGCDTTLAFPDERVMKNLFTPEMARTFQKYYEDRGVHFAPNTKIESVRGNSVELSNGGKAEADLVVAGIGVTPVTQLAEAAGIDVQNGIVVNEFLETSATNVYAAGDVANYPDALFGKRRRVEHWDNAVKQGQFVARHLSGRPERFENIPYFFSDIF